MSKITNLKINEFLIAILLKIRVSYLRFYFDIKIKKVWKKNNWIKKCEFNAFK